MIDQLLIDHKDLDSSQLAPCDQDSVKNYPFGYYQVGSQFYTNKSEALASASVLDVYPRWRFFNDTWKEQSWTGPSTDNIYNLYRARARQLREKYDYICLAFSGGSDSTTMLEAFIDSGLHIDELLVKWPIRATEKYQPTADRSSLNFLSEWHLTMLPLLEHYQKILAPKTKITVMDWSDQIIEKEASEESIWMSQDHFNPATYIKHSLVPKDTLKSMESGKATCMLYGIDRPSIAQNEGQIYCFFQDRSAHTSTSLKYNNFVEFFYWSPDFPDIVPCQAKLIFQHLEKNPEQVKLLDKLVGPGPSKANRLLWDDIVRRIVYPEYMKHNWFQAYKSHTRVFSESDQWMLTDSAMSRYVQSWQSNIKNRFNNVNEKFIDRQDGEIKGYMRFVGSIHFLGYIPPK